LFPPVPLRCGVKVSPQAALRSLSFFFGLGIDGAVSWGLFTLILFVVPRHTRFDLLKVGINTIHKNLANGAAILVPFIEFD
jgi:hypothetical protein